MLTLRVMAVSAPHWIKRGNFKTSLSLNSNEPFSLYNAIRYADYCAEKGIGVWRNSNWNNFETRRKSVLLMNYFYDEVDHFKAKLEEIKPNLLFIGAMTLSFRGAIELAGIAKQMFDEDILFHSPKIFSRYGSYTPLFF